MMRALAVVVFFVLGSSAFGDAITRGSFAPRTCSQNVLVGRPAGGHLNRIKGVCFGDIVQGPERVFVSFRTDSFMQVFVPFRRGRVGWRGIGVLDSRTGLFKPHSYEDVRNGVFDASARITWSAIGDPLAVHLVDSMGHKQKNINCRAFRRDLTPAELR